MIRSTDISEGDLTTYPRTFQLADAEKQDIAERTAALVLEAMLEKLHPSIINPPAEGPSPVGPDPRNITPIRTPGALDAPFPVSKGQIAAFNAKLGDLSRLLRVDKARLKTSALEWAGQRCDPPRELTSTTELTFDEMSDVLDWLEARVERERG